MTSAQKRDGYGVDAHDDAPLAVADARIAVAGRAPALGRPIRWLPRR
jgi:hypothetical protein